MSANPPVRRIETATGHYYVDANDRQIAGVTTILKALPKDALINWKIKKAIELALKGEKAFKDMPVGYNKNNWLAEAGEREALKAAGIGTNAHAFAEAHMLGDDPDLDVLDDKVRYHSECYLQFVRDYNPEPVLVEKVLTYIDPKTGVPLYCGTMDLVAKLYASEGVYTPEGWEDGLTWMIDYKASSSAARPSHALQASAYAHATHWIDEDGSLHEMVPVDRAAVLLLNGGKEGRCYRGFELDISPVVFSVFKSLLRISNFTKLEDRVIVGEL